MNKEKRARERADGQVKQAVTSVTWWDRNCYDDPPSSEELGDEEDDEGERGGKRGPRGKREDEETGRGL